jgi:hypothetical protein
VAAPTAALSLARCRCCLAASRSCCACRRPCRSSPSPIAARPGRAAQAAAAARQRAKASTPYAGTARCGLCARRWSACAPAAPAVAAMPRRTGARRGSRRGGVRQATRGARVHGCVRVHAREQVSEAACSQDESDLRWVGVGREQRRGRGASSSAGRRRAAGAAKLGERAEKRPRSRTPDGCRARDTQLCAPLRLPSRRGASRVGTAPSLVRLLGDVTVHPADLAVTAAVEWSVRCSGRCGCLWTLTPTACSFVSHAPRSPSSPRRTPAPWPRLPAHACSCRSSTASRRPSAPLPTPPSTHTCAPRTA